MVLNDFLIIWIRMILWNQRSNYEEKDSDFQLTRKTSEFCQMLSSVSWFHPSNWLNLKAQLPRQKLARRWCAEMRSFKFQISSMNSEWEAIKVLHSPLWITALKEEPLRGNWRLCKRSWLFSSHWIVSCTLPKTHPADCQL